jgi:DNA (cytosine-5)-methyltransferase 1
VTSSPRRTGAAAPPTLVPAAATSSAATGPPPGNPPLGGGSPERAVEPWGVAPAPAAVQSSAPAASPAGPADGGGAGSVGRQTRPGLGGGLGSGRPAVGSLCTGVLGLEMAVRAVLGGRVVWVAENDPAAGKVLAHHHPGVPNLGDITATDWAAVEPVDVLTAGFPCQDISSAGKRAGIEGSRSGVWRHVAHAVRDLRPRLVLLENVSALLVRGIDVVLADLAALGYVGSWRCIRASDVGAPHRRERVFILAWPAVGYADGLNREGRSAAGQQGETGSPAGPAADADGDAVRQQPEPEPRSGRTPVTGLPRSERGAATHSNGNGRPRGSERHGEPDAGIAAPQRHDVVGRVLDWGQYGPAVERWERVLGRAAPAPTEPAPRGGQRLSPRFVEWMMGLPAGHVTAVPGLSRNAQLRLLGNGVVPQQGAYALRQLLAALTEGAVA